MAQRANVPKFGNWENDSNTPYTVVFNNARKTRGGKMINPNDPQENPDMFPNYAPTQKPKAQTEEPMGLESARQTNKRRVNRENGDFHASSHGHNENRGGRVANEATHQRYGGRGSNSGRPARQIAGSDSARKSPLHPNSQAKVTGRVAAYDSSHSTPGRSFESAHATPGRSFESAHATPGRSFESSHATPGRHQMKQESRDRGAVVPKFGGWDENDPQSAENYTEVFNKVRVERNTRDMPGTPDRTSYGTARRHHDEKQKSCCFPLW